MQYSDALAYLDAHASYEKTGRIEAPTLDRIRAAGQALQNANLVLGLPETSGLSANGVAP